MSSLVFEILEEVSLRMASSGTGVTTISQPLVTITISRFVGLLSYNGVKTCGNTLCTASRRQKVQQLAESVIGDAANGPYYVMPSLTALESLLKHDTEVNVQVSEESWDTDFRRGVETSYSNLNCFIKCYWYVTC